MNSILEELQYFINGIKEFDNIKRKNILFPIIDKVRNKSFYSPNVYKSMGEDSAALFLNGPEDKELVLLTTDAISEEFSNKNPYMAGFSAILVGVDDIYACGGEVIAASCIISSQDNEIRIQLLNGLIEGSNKFKVPLVRGHTSDDTKNPGVSATVIGKIKKNNYISAGGAKPKDSIIIIADFDGKVGKANKYYWDTITFKNSDSILRKREIMNKISDMQLANASKDISNGGIFGTLILMLQYSRVGANINIEKIKIPKILQELNYSHLNFSKMYLTTAFILSIPPQNVKKVLDLCKDYDMTGFEIGKIINENNITLEYKGEKDELMKIKY